jgi:type IV secretory pathway VirB3-like protein
MNAPIYRHVTLPPKFIYASPKLLGIEFVAAILVALTFGTPLGAVIVLVVTHPICVIVTMREPHIDTVLAALNDRRPTRNHWHSQERVYVA